MTFSEEISDAQLRTWARGNGIEGVPSSGKLSVAWRDQIVNAMSSSNSEEELEAMREPEPTPVFEYRSEFRAPNTFVTSQYYTN